MSSSTVPKTPKQAKEAEYNGSIHQVMRPSAIASERELVKQLLPPKLKLDTNFRVFQWQLEGYLVLFDDAMKTALTEELTEDATSHAVEMHRRCRALLISLIDPETVSLVRPYDDGKSPSPMWKALLDHFLPMETYDVQELKIAFQELKMGSSLSFVEFVERIHDYSGRINAVQPGAIGESDKKLKLRQGVCMALRNTVTMLRVVPNLSYAEWVSQLRQAHKELIGDPAKPVRSEQGPPSAGSALFSVTENKGGKSNRKKNKCKICNKTGHLDKDCWSSDKNKRKSGTDGSADNKAKKGPRCYKCKETGHVRKNCPNKGKSGVEEEKHGDASFATGFTEDITHFGFLGVYAPAEQERRQEPEQPEVGHVTKHLERLFLEAHDALYRHKRRNPELSLEEYLTATGKKAPPFLIANAATIRQEAWVMDTGCNGVYTNNPDNLLRFTRCTGSLQTAASDGEPLPITGKGESVWSKNTYYVPGLKMNLVGPQVLADERNWTTQVSREGVVIKDHLGNIVAEGERQESNLYVVTSDLPPESFSANNRPAEHGESGDDDEDDSDSDSGTSSSGCNGGDDDSSADEDDDDSGGNCGGMVGDSGNNETDSRRGGGKAAAYLTVTGPTSLEGWHVRMGHISQGGLMELARQGKLPGIDVAKFTQQQPMSTCAACIQGKMIRKPFPKAASRRTTRKLELVHADVSGQMTTESGKSRYFIIFVDDFTRCVSLYLMETKGQALERFAQYLVDVCNPEGLQLGTLRTDDGGEFMSGDFQALCKDRGIRREVTARYSPSQNGVAERMMRTIVEMAKSMLFHANLPKWWWPFAVEYAAFLRNRSPTKALGGGVPFEAWTGLAPDYRLVQMFGVLAYVYVPETLRTKLDAKAVKGIFVGLSEGRKCYKIYLPATQRIVHSRDVSFVYDSSEAFELMAEENADPQLYPANVPYPDPVSVPGPPTTGASSSRNAVRSALQQTPARGRPPAHKSRASLQHVVEERKKVSESGGKGQGEVEKRAEVAKTQETPGVGVRFSEVVEAIPIPKTVQTTPSMAATRKSTDGMGSNDVRKKSVVTRGSRTRSGRTVNAPRKLSYFFVREGMLAQGKGGTLARDVPTPKTHSQAMRSAHCNEWRAAEQAELEAHKLNHTGKAVKTPDGVVPIETFWLYKVKETASGWVSKMKARWVVFGNKQIEGLDFTETYAPVAKMTSIRVFLSQVTILGWPVHQMDVATAFLNGTIGEEVYVLPPPGYHVKEGYSIKLERALYGLKQSPRAWNSTLHDYLVEECGYLATNSDSCIYVKYDENDSPICILVVYVDDILIAAATVQRINEFKKSMHDRFKMTDLGALEWYLGMKIKRDATYRALSITQELYIDKLIAKYGMENCVPIATPMAAGTELHKHDCPKEGSAAQKEMSRIPYRSVVGSLLYASVCTRPDISLAVSKVAKFVNNPGLTHWKAVVRIVQYLKGTKSHGLLYTKEGKTLLGYSDASWGDADNNRKSTTGYLFKHGENLVSWATYMQTSTARSTVEAEYMALSDASQEAVWLRRMLFEIGGVQRDSTEIMEDNQGCIAMALNPVGHKRLKHVEIRYHFLRELVCRGTVSLRYCPTARMTADVLTKPLSTVLFERHRKQMGMVDMNNLV